MATEDEYYGNKIESRSKPILFYWYFLSQFRRYGINVNNQDETSMSTF